MKKLFLLMMVISCGTLRAQDTIVKMNGSEVLAKVVLVDDKNVEYEKKDSNVVHHYTVPRAEIFMIKYAGGIREVLYKKQNQATAVPDQPATTAEGYKVLLVHPFVGDTIDLVEKKKYGLFPSYYFSNRDFKKCQFLQKPNGQIIIRAEMNDGKVMDRVSSQKELDHIRGKIGGGAGMSDASAVGIGVGVIAAALAAVVISVTLLLNNISSS